MPGILKMTKRYAYYLSFIKKKLLKFFPSITIVPPLLYTLQVGTTLAGLKTTTILIFGYYKLLFRIGCYFYDSHHCNFLGHDSVPIGK
jgi:hypothetical protein